MKASRRDLALLALVLTTFFGLGLGAGHHEEHSIEPEVAETPRFEAGHDAPISEEHVEAAHRLPAEECLACALRSPVSSPSLLDSGRAMPIPPIVVRGIDGPPAPTGDPVRLHAGRAPPARLPSFA